MSAEVDGDSFYYLYAEALECWDMGGLIGKETDLADAEVGDNLAAEAYLTEDALRICVPLSAWLAVVKDEAWGWCWGVHAETALSLMEIDEGASACGGDGAQWSVDCSSAVAESRAEDVSGEAVGMDSD
jgi:hypothetical protein